MYYVVKNGSEYMGADGMCTPHKSAALKIDPTLVQALRAGGWKEAGSLFAEVNPGDANYGSGIRIVKVNQSCDDAGDTDTPTVQNGQRI